MQSQPETTLFMFWGRRGALVRFALDLMEAAQSEPLLDPLISVSTANERYADFAAYRDQLLPIRTFSSGRGALLDAWRLPGLRAHLRKTIRERQITSVVTLLPHVWSPLTNSVFREMGVRDYAVVHDVDPHPGDRTARVIEWCHQDLARYHRLIALSGATANRLEEKFGVPPERILTLFHPEFEAGHRKPTEMPPDSAPIKLLFMGRIFPYKGLELLIGAAECLAAKGIAVELGVFGEGDISAYSQRLKALNAEVVNRWLSDQEIDQAMTRYHVMVLPYVEASQSGVAGLAQGIGMPIVATPVGGLVEQVDHGRTGLVAERADAAALADTLEHLNADRQLLSRLADGMRAAHGTRSMAQFVHFLAEDLIRSA